MAESREFSNAFVAQVERSESAGNRNFKSRSDRGETYASEEFLRAQEYADAVYSHEISSENFSDYREDLHERQNVRAQKNAEFFKEETVEFKEAVKKLSPELLRLLKSQFECEPALLVRRPEMEIEKITSENSLEISSDFSEELESETEDDL